MVIYKYNKTVHFFIPKKRMKIPQVVCYVIEWEPNKYPKIRNPRGTGENEGQSYVYYNRPK